MARAAQSDVSHPFYADGVRPEMSDRVHESAMLEASVAMQQAAIGTDVVCCACVKYPIRVSPVTVDDAAGDLFRLKGKTLIWRRSGGVGSWTVPIGERRGRVRTCETESIVH